MATATAEEVEFKLIPLEAIFPSGTNPRKSFDGKAMEDLTASIKEKGVLQPILVRFKPREQIAGMSISEHFELVAGERRWRAAKKAGLTEIPAVVRQLSDDQALEAQVIENLQRADVHPLEEADGYQALLKRSKYKVEDLAAKVGKSVSYIWQRLKLTELIPTAQQAFLSDQIFAGHAVMIARLQPNDQKEALRTCIGREWIGGQQQQTTISVRGLARWIQENIHLSLDGAPWRKDDEKLVPSAGPCTTCPKRSGNAPALWPEITREKICTDRGCYQSKLNAYSIQQKKDLEAMGERVERISEDYQPGEKGVIGIQAYQIAAKNKKRCPETIKGIYADGDKRGQVVDICVGDSCRIHRQRSVESHGPVRTAAEQKERAKEILKERATVMARESILSEVLKKTADLSNQDIRTVAEGIERRIYIRADRIEEGILRKDLQSPDDFAKASEKELARFLLLAALSHELTLESDANLLEAIASRRGIDIKAIEKKCLKSVVYDRAHKDRMQRWKGLKASGNTRFEILTCQLCGRTEVDQAKGGWHWIRKNDKNKTALCNDCERLERR